MIVSYQGNGYFRLQSGETVIDIDPTTGRTKSTIAVRTYFDGTIEELAENEIAFPGEYEIKEIEIYGYPSANSAAQDIRSIYRIEWEGTSFVILGDISRLPGPDVMSELVEPDVLIVPAGRAGVLSANEAVKMIRELEPSVVVPSYDASPKDLLKELGTSAASQEKFVFKKKELTPKAMQVVLLDMKK